MPRFSAQNKYAFSHRRKSVKKRIFQGILLILSLFLLYRVTVSFFISPYRIQSASMIPYLEKGDRVAVTPLLYGMMNPFNNRIIKPIQSPRRGDVILIVPPYYEYPSPLKRLLNPVVLFFTLGYADPITDHGSEWNTGYTVKRVAGLPGDTVRIENFTAYIKPSGENDFVSEYSLAENSYSVTKEGMPDDWPAEFPLSGTSPADRVLKSDEYYVLGDNRTASIDSRHWGPVSLQRIRGKIIFRY